jgi:hypothetical protein
MGVLLATCIIGNIPGVMKLFHWFSELFGGGLGPVNARMSVYTDIFLRTNALNGLAARNIFREITPEQVDAARFALRKPPTEPKVSGEHTFNLDVAKLLCV